VKKVISNYVRAVRDVGITIGAAIVVAYFLNRSRFSFLSDDFVRWLRVGTTACFAVATLGRGGWDIQTIGGVSPAEKLNTAIFHVLYLLAFALVALSFLIHPV